MAKQEETRYISQLPFAVGIRRLQTVSIPDIEILVTIKNADDAVFMIQYEGFWSMFFAPHIAGKLTYQPANQNMVIVYKIKPYGWRLPQMAMVVGILMLLLLPAIFAAGIVVLIGFPIVLLLLFFIFYPFFKDMLFKEQTDKLQYYLDHLLEVRDVTKRMDVWTG